MRINRIFQLKYSRVWHIIYRRGGRNELRSSKDDRAMHPKHWHKRSGCLNKRLQAAMKTGLGRAREQLVLTYLTYLVQVFGYFLSSSHTDMGAIAPIKKKNTKAVHGCECE